jgi:predicted kinase
MQPTLYMLVGLPGAGKTTAAKIIEELTGATRLSSDEVRLQMFPQPTFSPEEHTQLYNELNRRAEDLLHSGKSVIYDANLNRHEHRQEKYGMCLSTGAKPVLLWVQTPKETAKERASHASRAPLIPKNETAGQMFDRIAGIIESPSADESPILIDGTKITPEYIAEALHLA